MGINYAFSLYGTITICELSDNTVFVCACEYMDITEDFRQISKQKMSF